MLGLFTHHHSAPLSQSLHDAHGDAARSIRSVVKIGCIVNAILMILKLSAGYLGHSDALMADGFHSLNDVAADLIMLIFIGISYRTANEKYPYGYGKFETFSSFLMATMLIFIAIMIGVEGVESIIAFANGEVLDQPDIWTFLVVLFAMACKECLFRFYSRVAKRVGSNALLANAWHHRSDAMASVATLIGVSCAHFFGESWRILDPIASLVIAAFILFPALGLFRRAFYELMEHSLPKEDLDKVKQIVQSYDGVKQIVSLQSRKVGHNLVFNISVSLDNSLSLQKATEITAGIEQKLHDVYCPHVIVSVTIK